MKFGEITLSQDRYELIVFSRNGQQIPFKCKAVFDYTDFDKLCPQPQPPAVRKKGQKGVIYNIEDPDYKIAVQKYSVHKFHWMILQSLTATEWLRWETVDPSDYQTWGNFNEELVKAGFTVPEVAKLLETVYRANGISEQLFEEAKKSFLDQQGQEEESNFPLADPSNTSTGEPANDSA